MKMKSQIANMLMGQLKMLNPSQANTIQEMINNKNNPNEIFKQIMKDKTPQQMEQFFTFAKQYGVPENVIEQAQSDLK